jgi:hypothetical protein
LFIFIHMYIQYSLKFTFDAIRIKEHVKLNYMFT